jgi:hypothetical protein
MYYPILRPLYSFAKREASYLYAFFMPVGRMLLKLHYLAYNGSIQTNVEGEINAKLGSTDEA